jgi:hypothetical protein
MAQGKLVRKTFNLSIQDTNEEILKNIDRPDVGWDVHVAMANELRQSYPHLLVKAQLIFGLPGQTIESWKNTVANVVEKNIFPIIFFNEPLPSSPAMYDPKYQEQFQFEYGYSNRILNVKKFSSLITKSSNSFSQSDVVHMTVISGMIQAISAIKLTMIDHNLDIPNVDLLINTLIATPNYQALHNNLLTNWTVNNNFYYTINFSNEVDEIGDLFLGSRLVGDANFLSYINGHLPQHTQKAFLTLGITKKFKQQINDIFVDFD